MSEKIFISRHARRRIKLYKLERDFIASAISQTSKIGYQETLFEHTNFKYPIKIVFDRKENEVILITCYPQKKGII